MVAGRKALGWRGRPDRLRVAAHFNRQLGNLAV